MGVGEGHMTVSWVSGECGVAPIWVSGDLYDSIMGVGEWDVTPICMSVNIL